MTPGTPEHAVHHAQSILYELTFITSAGGGRRAATLTAPADSVSQVTLTYMHIHTQIYEWEELYSQFQQAALLLIPIFLT